MNYQELALKNYVVHHMIRDDDITHTVFGLSGEMHEVLRAVERQDLIEELGDMFNYCCVGYRGVGSQCCVAAHPVTTGSVADLQINLITAIGIFCDAAKRRVRYNDCKRFPDAVIRGRLDDVWMALCRLCDYYELPILEVLKANIDKLALRYPAGYTDYLANARLDKVGGAL